MIKVLSAGLYTTIQDLGRFGYRQYGVPVSGPADRSSAQLANVILQNGDNAPSLEMTIIGPTLEFAETCQITITGAEFTSTLNEVPIHNNSIIKTRAGDILKVGAAKNGVRGYLSIAGGFKSDLVMGSTSFYPDITKNSQLEKGNILLFNKVRNEIKPVNSNLVINKKSFNNSEMSVFKGPDFDLLSAEVKNVLKHAKFIVSRQSNRMGSRLISNSKIITEEIITSPVQPGTVQLTPSGQLIILGRDAQTTGGYARVFQLTEKAQDNLAQIRFGEEITFSMA